MKNTDPPSQNKFKKLSPELTRFIESMGLYFENSGIPRIGGRVLGLLMIAHDPLTADDIAKILKVSRASLSTNLRMLATSGLVEKTSILHDRTTYYIFPDASLEQRMQAGIQSAVTFKKVTEQGLAALPADDSARTRMKMSIEWSDLLIEYFEEAIVEWRRRYPDSSRK
jgi:DNA-binding transcriptional regulator GbsR (MarR family)